jgi:hypothetical protein
MLLVTEKLLTFLYATITHTHTYYYSASRHQGFKFKVGFIHVWLYILHFVVAKYLKFPLNISFEIYTQGGAL